ncbi:MAG TPA: hypothetical protein VKU38_04990 [Ktedonobacteraceae bacterium]|nr:hypothetical protein [Ktedonobacteraceae bacterium]
MATDPLSLVFIACFLFGLLFFIGTILLGNLGHADHAGHIGHTDLGHATHIGGHDVSHVSHTPVHSAQAQHSTTADHQGTHFSIAPYMNPTTIALFLLGFGFFGYVSHNTVQFVLPLTLVLAALGGLVVAALLLLLVGRLFGDSEGATIQDVSDRTGLLGKVSISIRENNIGEIIYVSPGGMRKSIPARSVSGQSIESGQEVVVVNYQRGNGIAEVDTWEHFMHENEEVEPQAQAQVQVQAQGQPLTPDADTLAKLRALLEESETANTELVIRNDSQKE